MLRSSREENKAGQVLFSLKLQRLNGNEGDHCVVLQAGRVGIDGFFPPQGNISTRGSGGETLSAPLPPRTLQQ